MGCCCISTGSGHIVPDIREAATQQIKKILAEMNLFIRQGRPDFCKESNVEWLMKLMPISSVFDKGNPKWDEFSKK